MADVDKKISNNKKIDNKRALRITFFSVIGSLTLLYLLLTELPNKVYGKDILCLFGAIVILILLISIYVRIYFKNVRKFEMIIYYIVVPILLILLVTLVLNLGFISAGYNKDADSREGIGLTILLIFFIFGLPILFISTVLCIVGLIVTLVSRNTTEEKIVVIEKNSENNCSEEIEINFCKNCGTSVDQNSNYCGKCGSKIR